jgi:hypothetical protein
VFHRDKKTLRYPLLRVDEMRLVRAGRREVGAMVDGARYDGAADGTSDMVYQLTLLDLSERRRVLGEILRTRTVPPHP